MDIHKRDEFLDELLKDWEVDKMDMPHGEYNFPKIKETIMFLEVLEPIVLLDKAKEAANKEIEDEISRLDSCVFNLIKAVPTLINTLRFLYNEGNEEIREKIRLALDPIDLYGHLPVAG